MKNDNNRIVYIDFIKVFLTCLVVAHHSGQAYGNTGGVWLVSHTPKVGYLKPFFFFNAAYMMGFYFFIAGFFTYYSLNNKPIRSYLMDRFRRLGIPLLFFALLIFGPLHYMLSNSESNYFYFLWDLHFNHPPLSLGHLWFVASLLAFSLLYLLIVKWVKMENRFSEAFKWWYALLYLLFLIPITIWVRNYYPIDHWVTWIIPIEVAHLPQYLSLFLLGALFNKTKWLHAIQPAVAFSYMFVGLLSFFFKDAIYQALPKLWSEAIIESFLCVGLCLGFISIFKIASFKMNMFFKFLSDNAYGIYLFRLLIVIGLQMMLLDIELDTNLKFVMVTISGILISAALSFILRKNKLIRKII
ncbi:MAG: hypothetical protein COA40_07785 [Aequorivita sp.]|nr:MAG: hypothetical protein COA40_07785 [Aequorivita sp.]